MLLCAIDDDTALAVTDGDIEVVSAGTGEASTRPRGGFVADAGHGEGWPRTRTASPWRRVRCGGVTNGS